MNRLRTLHFVLLCAYGVTTFVSMALMNIFAGLVGILTVLIWALETRAQKRSFSFGRTQRIFFWISLALLFSLCLSLVNGLWNPLSYGGKFAAVDFPKDIAKGWYVIWPLVLWMALVRTSPERRAIVLKSWMLGALAIATVGVIQFFSGWPRGSRIPGLDQFFHSYAWLGHHLTFSNIFIFPLFFSLEAFLNPSRFRALKIPRWVLAITFCFIFLALLMTFSRILWATIPLTLAVYFIWALPLRAKIASTLVLVIGLVCVLQLSFVRSRLDSQFGTHSRIYLWQANRAFFNQRPLLGVGWKKNYELSGYFLMQGGSTSVFSGHAHNVALDMLSGTGLVGTLFWTLWWGIIMVWLYHHRNTRTPQFAARALFCAWLTFMLNGLTQENFWDAKVTHQVTWVIAWTLLWVGMSNSRGKSAHGKT